MNFRDFPNYDWWRNSEQVRSAIWYAASVAMPANHTALGKRLRDAADDLWANSTLKAGKVKFCYR